MMSLRPSNHRPPHGSAHTLHTSANTVDGMWTARNGIAPIAEGGQTIMSKAIMKRSCKSVVTFLKGVINANCEEGFKWFPEISETDVDVSAIDILYAIEVLERVDDQKIEVVTNELHDMWKLF